jgi:transposase
LPGPRPQYRIELNAEQINSLTELSRTYTAPFVHVQRARMLLLAHQQPEWSNQDIARCVGCHVDTVRVWRRRWQSDPVLTDRPRSGAPRYLTPIERARVIAVACSSPRDHGKVWAQWSAEKLAVVTVEKKIAKSISSSTIRRWLRADRIKPWRYHSWQKPTDPTFVEKASPILDLYERAAELKEQGELVICTDEKTSIQARQRLDPTRPAISGQPMHLSHRYKRMGALQLFCALMVATGRTFARTRRAKKFTDFKAFLKELLASALCKRAKVLHLIMDNGPTHAPKQLGTWIASMKLSFELRLYWLPKNASWLDQVEIIFSKVQREVLTPNDFPSVQLLERNLTDYFK